MPIILKSWERQFGRYFFISFPLMKTHSMAFVRWGNPHGAVTTETLHWAPQKVTGTRIISQNLSWTASNPFSSPCCPWAPQKVSVWAHTEHKQISELLDLVPVRENYIRWSNHSESCCLWCDQLLQWRQQCQKESPQGPWRYSGYLLRCCTKQDGQGQDKKSRFSSLCGEQEKKKNQSEWAKRL